uniref:F-box domain-containing protein n=1 Tax=viral metagenome TaxID=1070528 RepID=A0A6C0C816_9ZZZZ
MDQILFGDIFVNIEQYLCIKDLYELSWSCKIFNNIITEEYIKKKAVNEINMRLRCNLGDNYNGFVEIMQKMDAALVGSSITQCLLNKTWKDGAFNIFTTVPMNAISPLKDYSNFSSESSDESNDNQDDSEIMKFMRAKGYVTKKTVVVRYDRHQHHIFLSPIHCYVNNLRIHLCPLYHSSKPITINQYTHNYIEYSVYKNIYKFTNNELYIHDMRGIFEKCTNLEAKHIYQAIDFYRTHRRGFKFYRAGSDKKLLSNNDILYSYFDVVRIRSNHKTIKNIFYRNKEHYIKNSTVRGVNKDEKIYDILEMSLHDKNKHFHVGKCGRSELCAVKLLCPEKTHLHCSYLDDNSSSEDLADEKELILIFV